MKAFRWGVMIPCRSIVGLTIIFGLLNRGYCDPSLCAFFGTLGYLVAGTLVAPVRVLGAQLLTAAVLLFLGVVFLGDIPQMMDGDECLEYASSSTAMKEWGMIAISVVTATATLFVLLRLLRLYRFRLPEHGMEKRHYG